MLAQLSPKSLVLGRYADRPGDFCPGPPEGFTTSCAGSHRVRGFPKLGAQFWGCPHEKDYSILGSILGSPIWGNLGVAPGTAHYWVV